MKLRLSLAAELDLINIKDTISAENPDAAERVQRSIVGAINLLKSFPYLGWPGSVLGTREKTVRSLPYVIVYAVGVNELIILRVYHGARNRP